MESLFEVGDIVYVQGKVISVEEQEDDVRYSVITSIAKYFCTEKKDKIRRSADSQNMLKKSFNEGRESYHEVLNHIINMDDDIREEVFGYSDISKILTQYFTADEIIEMYSNWVNTINVKISDIVSYTTNNQTYEAIVLNVMVDIGGTSLVNANELSEEQLADPRILYSKVLYLYDPVNKIFFSDISVSEITPTGKSLDITSHLEDIKNDFEDVMTEDQKITGAPIINKVESKNDINYDEYYNDDEE